MTRTDDENRARIAQPSAEPSSDLRISSGMRAKVAHTNIEPAPSRLVGRQGELDAIAQLVARERHVTLLGAPGIGKTRVAREVAMRMLPSLAAEGGAWMVSLGEAMGVEGVCGALARALDVRIPSDGGEDLLAQVGAVLAARGRTLFVLDGAEHVAEATSRALETWKRVAREARWLVTSRSRLTTPGEVLFELGPLSFHPHAPDPTQPRVSDAVRLFADRSPVEVLGANEVGTLAQLVRALDGNALAIELVGACTRLASPRDLLVEVVRELDKKSSLARRVHPRHLALRAAIDVAWSKLPAWAQSAAAQLSVFAGAFEDDAAQQVIGVELPDDLRVNDALEELRLRRILSGTICADGALRYWMHSSVREIAAERLGEAGGRTATQARHARWFLQREATPADEAELLAVHRRGSGEESLAASLALDGLLAANGPAALRFLLVDEALAGATEIPDALRARAHAARGEAHRALGRLDLAAADLTTAAELSRDLRDRATHGRALLGLGEIAEARGELALARARLEQAMADFVAVGDASRAAESVAGLARVHRAEGRLDLATATLDQAIGMYRAGRDKLGEADAMRAQAEVALDRGDVPAARALADRTLAVLAEQADDVAQAETIGVLARVAFDEARLDDAQSLFARAVRLHAANADRRGEGTLLARSAAVAIESGELEDARLALARSLVLLRECKDRHAEGLALAQLAVLEAIEGGVESARAALHRAAETAQARESERLVVELARGHLEIALAQSAQRTGDDARVRSYVESVRRRIDSASRALDRSADVRLAVRALERALHAFETAEPPPVSGFAPEPRRRSSTQVPAQLPAIDREGYPEDALLVCAKGRWFRPPRGANVPIDRWQALQNLVVKLAERREIAPGETLSVEELVAAGWPGERVLPKAGATRVYTALSTLRRLGMREVLVRRAGGYMFDPDVPLMRVTPR